MTAYSAADWTSFGAAVATAAATLAGLLYACPDRGVDGCFRQVPIGPRGPSVRVISSEVIAPPGRVAAGQLATLVNAAARGGRGWAEGS